MSQQDCLEMLMETSELRDNTGRKKGKKKKKAGLVLLLKGAKHNRNPLNTHSGWLLCPHTSFWVLVTHTAIYSSFLTLRAAASWHT